MFSVGRNIESKVAKGHQVMATVSSRMMGVMLVMMGGMLLASGVQAAPLTAAQRQDYLYYYAPVLLKRADENSSSRVGRDWISNFDFDRDGNFSNNRLNWINVNQYVAAAGGAGSPYGNWRIRPTMYSAVLEFTDAGQKSLVLLYHVYNAADKGASEIHDWERIEIVLRGAAGAPGASGEYVSSVTTTHHHDHIIRSHGAAGLNFMETATGKHVLIWQADQSSGSLCDTNGHELRFVTNPYSSIATQAATLSNDAEVNISGKDKKKNVNYVFVPERSSSAINAWSAQRLTYANASSLASRSSGTVPWSNVKRLTYELQDLADIIPTHWSGTQWYTHWLSNTSRAILLESPIVNELEQIEVPAGLQVFYTKSRDAGASDLTDGREGIPQKGWLFGDHSVEADEDCPSGSDDFGGFEGSGIDSAGYTRGAASGYPESHGSYWWQHDFFVHSGGLIGDEHREAGTWLRGAWYTPENSGFDGRWVQLFEDLPAVD